MKNHFVYLTVMSGKVYHFGGIGLKTGLSIWHRRGEGHVDERFELHFRNPYTKWKV